jgi:hypothetical protein
MNRVTIQLLCLGLAILLLTPIAGVIAQETTWMSVGSLHNWYSAQGSEIEEGRIKEQQDGLRWPAFYQHQDMQAAKALWIATTNFNDGTKVYTHKVVHVGPRVDGKGEFSPQQFEMVSRFDPPQVYVDGALSVPEAAASVSRIDPTMKPDRMIINKVGTAIGITMTRKIFQFSQQYHDNYIVSDYVFENTSSKTLTGVYFYFQYRLSVCADTRYVIGNATGWGINAMLDIRGDGRKNDTDDAISVPGYSAPHMRIQYVWHGKYPPFTQYDNIGAPIWTPYYDKTDTSGRLGGAQFLGVVTLHADRSPTDTTDDLAQPSTMGYEGSDEPLTSGNDQFNESKMTQEYEWVSKGRTNPAQRHADRVEPLGLFNVPTGDPSLGTPGGFSNANGFGPYTLAPGQKIHIALAEGAAGLNRQACISIGRKFRLGQMTAKAKNDSVLTGKDSLFNSFRRAIANFKSGYAIPTPPAPPKVLNVNSAGDKISLAWDVYDAGDPNLTGFQIYRATGRYDAEYSLVATLGASARSYDDVQVTRGVAHYYYVVSVGSPSTNTGGGLTPAGVPLVSNRIYSQTYDPAFLKRQAGNSLGVNNMDSIRIVPNPYHIGSDPDQLRFSKEPDKIAFFNIPGYCKIRIYTELGELIYEADHQDGSGDAYWNSVTSARQVIVSGVYIVVFDNLTTGQRVIKKLSVIR